MRAVGTALVGVAVAEPHAGRLGLAHENHLLTDRYRNKGTAFTAAERDSLHLHGLLPPAIEDLDMQLERVAVEESLKSDDLERHVFLRALQERNSVLFYAYLTRHLERLLPIVYTPTVGLACQQWSRVYRREHGLYLSWPLRHRVDEMLRGIVGDRRIDAIVVTDGERVLGLGDLGVGGMGIPIGKLALYTAAGGIDPERTLPVVLDVGTEAIPADVVRWTEGRALIGTGSPFDPVAHGLARAHGPLRTLDHRADLVGAGDSMVPSARPGRRHRPARLVHRDDHQSPGTLALTVPSFCRSPTRLHGREGRTHTISEVNNLSVFPGVGLGTIAVGTRAVSDEMLTAAANVIGEFANSDDKPSGLLPSLGDARALAVQVARAVARTAIAQGLAETPGQPLDELVEATIWSPAYD